MLGRLSQTIRAPALPYGGSIRHVLRTVAQGHLRVHSLRTPEDLQGHLLTYLVLRDQSLQLAHVRDRPAVHRDYDVAASDDPARPSDGNSILAPDASLQGRAARGHLSCRWSGGVSLDGAGEREPVRGLYVAVQRGDYALGLGAAVAEGVPDGDDRLAHLQS